ncbi:MAG: Sensor protein [uncultured bacterium]|nr:MAG: Sensor protein [uncultured bacterium]
METIGKNISSDFLSNCCDAFFEHCGDLIVVLDQEFKIIMLNPFAKGVLDLSNHEAIGQNLFALCKRKHIQLSFIEQDLKYPKKFKNEFTRGHILYAQEQKRFMLWKWLFIKIRQNNACCFLILGKDISALEKYKEDSLLTEAHLNNIMENLPEYIYWKDASLVYRGCNKHVSDYLSLPSPRNIVGKTDKDFGWSKERIQVLYEIDKEILETGVPSIVEDIIPRPDGSQRIMLSSKTPLRDANNNVIGIVGISVDITDRKNAEELQAEKDRLNIENKGHIKVIKEQEKFKEIASRVAHDIRSPLASLSMIVESCKNLPEAERIALRDVAVSVSDIANNLLSKYTKNGDDTCDETKELQRILVSLALSEGVSEKKYQYKHLPVKFRCSFEQDSKFIFIRVNPTSFNRMISNLINNSVESFEGGPGKIDLNLSVDGKYIKIAIQDNGKGIPKEVLDKIMNNIAVTSGKKCGTGIGLAQVRSTLQFSNGNLTIESKIGYGTKITLTFPRVEPARWIVKEINLNKGDTVVILDDDLSIHGAWKTRFDPYRTDIQLQHFKLYKEAVEFIETAATKDKIFFLSDFELINQELNGLQVIEQLAMQPRSILVTSYYGNQNVQDLANKSGVKILPKQLASDIPINITEKKDGKDSKKVDVVIVDDNQLFTDSLASFLKDKDIVVDAYYSPKTFLENLSQYTKDIKICLDNDFHDHITGIALAKKLNEAGYTQLYMLSGKSFEKGEVPNYLTVLLKSDMEDISKLI